MASLVTEEPQYYVYTYIACLALHHKNRLTSHFLLLHHFTLLRLATIRSYNTVVFWVIPPWGLVPGRRQNMLLPYSEYERTFWESGCLCKVSGLKLVAPLHDPQINVHSLPLLSPSSNSSDISTTLCSFHNNQINSLLAWPRTRILSQTLTADHTAVIDWNAEINHAHHHVFTHTYTHTYTHTHTELTRIRAA